MALAFSRGFLDLWWGSADDRKYFSDQEQFDILYNKFIIMNDYTSVEKIIILPPDALNSDPPAMTKQLPHNKILHLMGEHTEFRTKAFSNGFKEICSFLHKDSKHGRNDKQLTGKTNMQTSLNK